MRKTDLAYIAGIVDGEGCIYIQRQRTKRSPFYFYAAIQVGMTEEHIPRWLQLSFGGWISVAKQNDPTRRPLYVWRASGQTAVDFLKAILPYLIIKRPQAEVAIRLEALKPGHGKRSSPIDKFLQELEAKNLKNPRGGKPVKEE